MCAQHAFLEGKKAEETSPRKSTPRTLKEVDQQYPSVSFTGLPKMQTLNLLKSHLTEGFETFFAAALSVRKFVCSQWTSVPVATTAAETLPRSSCQERTIPPCARGASDNALSVTQARHDRAG